MSASSIALAWGGSQGFYESRSSVVIDPNLATLINEVVGNVKSSAFQKCCRLVGSLISSSIFIFSTRNLYENIVVCVQAKQ